LEAFVVTMQREGRAGPFVGADPGTSRAISVRQAAEKLDVALASGDLLASDDLAL